MAVPIQPPPLNINAPATSSAASGLGGVSYGNVSKGINSFVFIGALLLVGTIVWKLNK